MITRQWFFARCLFVLGMTGVTPAFAKQDLGAAVANFIPSFCEEAMGHEGLDFNL